MEIRHPGQYLQESLKQRGWTQKDFAHLIGKKVSEVNELIKGKRNITIQWDILLSALFDDPEQKWSRLQLEYDYHMAKGSIDSQKVQDIKAKKIGNDLEERTKESEKEKTIKKEETKEEKIVDKPVKDKKKEHEIFRNF